MNRIAMVLGIFLLGGGVFLLPPPPASPAAIGASFAPVLFFFGGSFLFSGIFALKNPAHGQAAILILGLMGVIYSAYLFLFHPLNLGQQVSISGLGLISIYLFTVSFLSWKKKRREANLRRLEEMDGEKMT